MVTRAGAPRHSLRRHMTRDNSRVRSVARRWPAPARPVDPLTIARYEQLSRVEEQPGGLPSPAQFRYEIRKFLAFSEAAARSAGIEPQQHQALLAIKGLTAAIDPTIDALAERLCVQHHTAVALVDKLARRGWAKRERASADRRQALLSLTAKGSALLAKLSAMHREQLGAVGAGMLQALEAHRQRASRQAGAEALRRSAHRRGLERGSERGLERALVRGYAAWGLRCFDT